MTKPIKIIILLSINKKLESPILN